MTRLRTAPVVLAALLVAACSNSEEASDATEGPSAAPAPGSSTAAADDQVVVALDDFAAINALSVGVEPDLVLEVFEYETTSAVFADLGLETAPYGDALPLERVVAAEPDVILGVSIPTTVEAEAQLDAVAPTTVLDYTASWQEQLTATAAALGREDEAGELQERLEGDLETLAADLAAAGRAGDVVSVVADNGGTFSPPVATSVGSVIAAAGLERPAAQQQTTTPSSPFVQFSPETLADHDGDVLYLLSGVPYVTTGLTGNPLWGRLGAVAGGQVHEVSGESWLGSSAFSVDWVVRDLRATLLDGGEAASPAEAPTRFAEFADA